MGALGEIAEEDRRAEQGRTRKIKWDTEGGHKIPGHPITHI